MGVMDRYNKKKKTEEESESKTKSGGVAERYEKNQYYQTLNTDGVDDNYINTFTADTNRFFSKIGKNSVSYDEANSTLEDLSTRYDTIQGWLHKNKSKLDDETYKSFTSTFDGLKSSFDSVKDYYSQWKSDDDYNKYLMGWLDSDAEINEETAAKRKKQYQSNEGRIGEIKGKLPWYGDTFLPSFVENWFLSDEDEAIKEEMETLEAENRQYKRTQGVLDQYYTPVTDEFTKNAAYRDYTNPTKDELRAFDANRSNAELNIYSFDGENYRDHAGNIIQYSDDPGIADKLGLFLSATDEDITEAYNALSAAGGNYTDTWANLMKEGDANGWKQLKENEINIYYDLYKREGKEAAYQYLDAMTTELTRRATQATTDYINNEASTLEKIGLNIASVPMNVFGSAASFVDDVSHIIKGEDINPYSKAHSLQNAASDVRTKTAADINELTGNAALPWVGTTFGDVYQSLMSAADSALGVAIGGNAYGVLMGMGAASSEMKKLYEQGASTGQMVAGGVLAGAAEMVFEKYSIDKLVSMGDSKTIKDVVINLLKQGGVEASEEVFTEIANTITNVIVMGSQSDWVDVETFAKNVVNAGIGGFISGGGMGGVYGTAGYVNYGNQAKKYGQSIMEQGGVDTVQQLASDMSADKNALNAKRIGKLSGKVASNATAKNVGKLADLMGDTVSTQNVTDIQNALVEKGLSKKEAKRVAEYLNKAAQGEYFTDKEAAEVENDERISEVYLSLIGDTKSSVNTRTQKLSSAISGEEYSRIVEAAQLPQEAAEVNGEEVAAEAKKVAQQSQTAPAGAVNAVNDASNANSVLDNATAPANDQQMTGKLVAEESSVAPEETVTIEAASKKYGAQAQAMIRTYSDGQDVEKFDKAYQVAYDMGRSGVSFDYVKGSASVSYLTDSQKELAYTTGKDAADAKAKAKDAKNKAAANGKTGWKKGGVVRGEGVTIADLRQAVGDTRGKAYKVLSTIAKVTGVNIVLCKSRTDADGNFIDENGEFNPEKPNEIRISIDAGLENIHDVDELAKYILLRTFSHEFTHFIEYWNPIQYNEFRKAVFDELTRRGKNVNDLIETKMKEEGLGYEAASREVVADAMVDILPDSHFVQTLAEKHKNIFQKLIEKLKEFANNLREYFDNVGYDPKAVGAHALQEEVGGAIKYVDSIVQLFDKVAVQTVENFQQTVATEEVVVSKNENTTTETKVETKPEKVETSVEATTEETTTSEHGFTITDNAEYGSLEIAFDGKPPKAVLDALKSNKFRWHKVKKVWYGKADRDAITKALNEAFEAETVATENPAMQTMRDMGAKPVGENMLDVTDLMFPELKQEKTTTAPDQSDFEKAFWNASQEERDEVVDAIHENTKISHIAPTEIREQVDVETNEEVTSNGESENGPDTPAVHEPVLGSEGPARLLEGVEPNAVQGSDEGRQPVQSGIDQGPADAGRDRGTDEAGSVPVRSTGDRVGGDLQQLQSVSEEEQAARDYASEKGYGIAVNSMAKHKGMTQIDLHDKSGLPTFNPIIIHEESDWNKVKEAIDKREAADKAKAEKLHEEVQRQIAQKSTENPKGSNFVIGDSLNLPNGTKARTRANIEAIKLVKQIAAEGRIATGAEQEILSKYVGWGGLADAFGKPVSNRETRKIEYEAVKGLEAEFEELKSVLTEEEYKSARESTKNAHYTSIEVIKAMYDGLKQLGFTGGRMLEPSSGVGNFVGAMPADMSAQVKSWTMVELDHITGLFAKYLYPNADVRIQGFEESNIPDGYMDVAIGNVPFGNYAITDKHYPKAVTGAIHNYFFAKSLDKVRTGGIVMFITSSYTMNGRDNAVRKYIMQRADLLGAIRLPNTAFAGNAGTEVVTDILILKKRADRTEYAGEAFENSNWERVSNTGWDGAYVNEYFAAHPEMVLGTPKLTRGMYSANELTYDPFTDRGSLGDQIRDAMKNIQGKMDYTAQLSAEKENFRQASTKKKSQKLQVKDGVIHAKDENGNLTRVDVDKDTADRITGMVAIRDAHTALCDAMQQGVNKKETNALRKALNKAYDSFVEKYGYLNSNKNKKAIKAFADCYAILSLENYNTEGKKIVATKSDIFTKDTIAANRTATSAENVEEGLTISLNTVGHVDVGMIAKLTGQKAESVTRQLIDQRLVFKDKEGNLIPAAQYLSGNVRAKLREMEGLTGIDSDYQNNVEALREVVPPTVQHTDIYVNPGANWVPVDVYENFVGHILNRSNYVGYRTGKKDFSVEYVPETNEYKVSINDAYAKMSAQNTQVWGESGKSFSTIFENMLNGRRTNVYKDAGDGTRVLDKAKTEAVAEKVEKLNEEFRKWLWEDESRRTEMQELYNETYNALVTPKYSGSSLTVNGLNSEYSLRDHQKDAVARIINSGGNTLLAHRVGAGKTMEMAAAAMKLKQLGVIKKPMFVVPNNVVAQWGKEFKDYFPAANILMVGDEDMTPAERMTTINKIKNNDYDAVILAYTKFEKIQMTTEWRQKFYEEQIDSLMFAINAEKESQGGKGFTVKQLETKRKQLEARVKKLTDKAKDEDGAMFEDLGVDSLFVDEAHNLKNLEYSTRMNNVSGLGKADGAQRSFDLYTKVRYLQQLNGGRGVVFATATPVMNSMTEMYIMQKYLQPDTLKQLGIEHFDSWAKMFGEVVNALEIAPSGSGYRLKQTFSKFKNVRALQQLFRSFTDVLTDVPGLKIPKMKGRKVQIVECEQSEFQKNYMAELAKRAENVKNVDPTEDNMLKITSDGRKISYSQRMIEPTLPYEETGKIYKCCDNVYAVYQESNQIKGTQMIFCDMATPKGKSKTETDTDTEEFGSMDMESAQLYDDIKSRLVQLGIPAKEIAFIHDAKNDKQKAELAEKMNNGTIRVLIGSTGKMGVGLNAQKKAAAIHHLDAPWRPGDIEQRDGRVFRQKNQNEEAYKFVYVTRGSFDSRLWDILERKQKFINQVMNGEDVGNEIEDTGEVTLSAAEVKAVASDNPLIMEQVALEKEISKLQSLQQAHRSNVSRAEEKMVTDRRNIALLENLISNVQADIQNRKDTYSSDKVFSIQIGLQTFTDKKDAGTALVTVAQAQAKEGEYTDIGGFAGFALRAVKTKEGVKGMVAGTGNYDFKTYPGNPTFGINHLVAVVEGLEERLAHWGKNLSEAKSDLETQKQLAAAPFDQAEKLKQKRARYNEVMDILNPPKEEQTLDSDGGDTVQYQRRKRPDLGDIRDDIYYPKNSRDAHAFIRSYADQTSGMLDGEMKNVFVTTADYAYFVTATGYLKGDIQRVLPILGNENLINDMRKEFRNVTNTGRETISAWVEDLRSVGGRDGGNRSAAENGGSTVRNDVLDGGPSGSNTFGSDWESLGYNSWEELLEAVKNGAMVMDDDGNLIVNKQYQQRTNTLTNREVLALAASELQSADLSAAEKDALDIFQQRLAKLEALQTERADQGRLYKEQQFGTKVDREAAAQTLNRMHVLDGQIEKAKAEVLSIEDKQVLNRVLQKARKVVEKQQWTKDQETLQRWRDRRNNADAIKKYRGRLTKDVNDLTNWVLHPNNKDVVKHIPDVLKTSVIPFLSSIDFTSKKQLRGGDATKADKEFMKRLNGLKAALRPNQSADGLYADYSDLPPNFMERLQMLIDSAQAIVERSSGEFVVNQMTSDELRELSQVVRTLKEFIQNFNKFHVNAMFQHVHEAGDNTIGELGQMGNASDRTGTISNFVLWQQIRPAYAWERFGEGGKAIYDGLRRGQATLAFNTKKIQEFAEQAYTEAEVKAWEKQTKEIQLGNDIVKMPVSTIMSFYELSKRPQALGHILGQGIRVATYMSGGKKISDVGHVVTLEDVQTIIGTLTDRQKEVADSLQKFMQEQGGKWGNYVSVKRFGEELFGEDHYFPINSDGRHLAANADEHPSAASLYALLNMGFTKATTEGANNRLVLYSIFDVFANHMASMAQYNAFALPVVDAIKWFNYQQKSEPDEDGKRLVLGSVRDQMDRVYGVPEESRPGSGRQGYAQSFVINILKAFNGTEAQGVPTDTTGLNSLRQYNMAQVAFNFRVVVQQPLAITRAALLVDYGSIMKGMKLKPAAIQQNIQEMQRYSGIAAWKSLGFYDVNISRGLTDIIKHSATWRDKISNVGMWGAEKADLLTWAGIWSACKEEVIKKQKLTPKSEGFYEAVTQLFEEVIYKTQVVDSVLTKNEYMRSKGFFARATGSFMSEPTTTASMLIDAYDKYHADLQRGMTRQQAWKKNGRMIGRTAYAYGLSAVILAAVQAVADAFRDDDDYQTFLEKWLEAFGGNLVDEIMPVNKLPLLSDFYEVAKELIATWTGWDIYGNAPQSVFMQWYDSLIKGMDILKDKIFGEDTNYTWYGGIYKLLQATSGISGLPMAAATREIITAWNNTVGAMAPSLKVKTYDPGEKNEIKYAYQDGYLTDEEAITQLLQQGLVDTEDEAYWTIQGWEAGDGYSRYDAIYDAVRNGGNIDAAMAELTSHGYKEKDVRSQINSKIGEWYKEGQITKQQATNMLIKYSSMDSEDITATVNKWSSKVVTGIAFEDIKDEYFDGNITADRAVDMYVRYGGYTQDKASETVTKWRAELETGIAYDDIDEAFNAGEISKGDARNMYITYGGLTEEKATEKVTVLEFVKKNPECDGISYAAVENYQTYCETSGVPAGTYYDVWKYDSDTKADVDANGDSISGSKKSKVLAYINQQDLTKAQKDSLYYAFGWAESKITEAPWH